ncbi:MAG: HNH endonuclease [Pseudomonadota bacterium]
MRKLKKPTRDAKTVYELCISKVKKPALKAALAAISPTVQGEAASYEVRATAGNLHTMATFPNIGGLTNKEFNKVYTSRMASPKAPGRAIYDEIFISSKICPLCGHGKVTTVDHHLPKAHYPALTVTPVNLVPACSDCNKLKDDVVSSVPTRQTIHPYYDDFDLDQWLFANINQVDHVFEFHVKRPEIWSQTKYLRAKFHLKTFGLPTLFSLHAVEELNDRLLTLNKILAAGGSFAVKDDFLETAESCKNNHLNSWKTAMYQALADSPWSCAGGFRDLAAG